MELFHCLQELRSNMTAREKSIAECPQKGQSQARTRSGTPFSKQFPSYFHSSPQHGTQATTKAFLVMETNHLHPKQLRTRQQRKLVGTQIQPHHNWLKSTACQLNQPHSLHVPPSRPWQLECVFALMRVYFPGRTVELEHRPSAKYLGKAVEPIDCSSS